MKKLIALLLAVAMVACLFAGCQSDTKQTDAPTEKPTEAPTEATRGEETEAPTEAPTESDVPDIYMITDKGDINDKSFNQGTWEGIQAWCAANNRQCAYLKPAEATDAEYINSIEQAIKAGAKVVVTPGFLFEVPIYTVQEQYPDVKFILIDGNPHNADYSDYKTAANTVGITFQEEQVGYLAGYAAVMDGHTKLGFMGGQAVPAVIRYGYGFVQGANDAAAEKGITVDMMYTNTNGFAATPEAQAMAASWYKSGTTIVFGCGGSLGNSVFAAAEAENGLSIGVDVDQSAESATIVTSAMKGLAAAVSQMLDNYVNDKFPGGQNLVLGAKDNAVSLAMDTAKFTTFDQATYEALYKKLADGEITIKVDTDAESADALDTPNCNVTIVKQ